MGSSARTETQLRRNPKARIIFLTTAYSQSGAGNPFERRNSGLNSLL
jgi:hypothetical protein